MKDKILMKGLKNEIEQINLNPKILEKIKIKCNNTVPVTNTGATKIYDFNTDKKTSFKFKTFSKFASVIAASLAVIVFSVIYIPKLIKPAGENITEGRVFSIGKNEEAIYKVSVFAYSYDDKYIAPIKDELLNQFENSNSVYIEAFDAKKSQSLQDKQIDKQIAKGANLILINIIDPSTDAAKNIISKAKSVDIPVIFFIKQVHEKVLNSYDKACFLSIDYLSSGKVQGNLIFQSLKKDWDDINNKYKTFDKDSNGELSCVLFRGDMFSLDAQLRAQAINEANILLKASGMGEIKVADTFNADWQRDKARNYFRTNYTGLSATKSLPEIIVCGNDDLAIGVIDALEDIDYNLKNTNDALAGYIPIFGFDGFTEFWKYFNDGRIEGTVFPQVEATAIAMAVIINNFANGKTFLEDTDYSFEPKVKILYVGYGTILKN